MEASDDTEEPPLLLALTRFQVSEEFGFLLPDPLTELPAPYGPWMDIARELPQLIMSHQLRSHVHQMPQLSTQHLRGREELHLAHLVLSCITMGYVWQEGEEGTVQVLPRNLAVPYWEVSQALGLPPILSHADFVLANWRRKDPNGPLEIENLDTIITLPGGESLRGFILVTLLVEKAAVPGIKAIIGALRAILQCDEETLHRALQELAGAIEAMSEALRRMHDYVDPEVFYTVIRIFLSGCLPAQDEGLHAPTPQSLCGGDPAGRVPEAARALLGGRAAPRHVQSLRVCTDRLQVLPHHHRHQVHHHCGGQSQGRPGRAEFQGWPLWGKAPFCPGGQRNRWVPHLQLPEEHQEHHQGGDDKCLTYLRVAQSGCRRPRGFGVYLPFTSQDPKPPLSSSLPTCARLGREEHVRCC
ncbi:indoleamine 2,3-dioxygenase 2-like isoform X1 [Corvus hawaiiensis]|uniref:indoleamine 2,3-dioxygenase 2-like isoform X1 n=2 Tax=Corvus hawaiiensis TaxID=134902 RepID=UPI00201901F6|nr:indoleamine 2,3-dioxygenase 2-like isoform X1 [Corvus hawaiiensis]